MADSVFDNESMFSSSKLFASLHAPHTASDGVHTYQRETQARTCTFAVHMPEANLMNGKGVQNHPWCRHIFCRSTGVGRWCATQGRASIKSL